MTPEKLETQAIAYYADIITEQFKYVTRSEMSYQQLKDLANKTAILIIKGDK